MTFNDKGVVAVPSNHSVGDIVQRLRQLLERKGIKLFAFIDHSGEVEQVGMKMLPTKLRNRIGSSIGATFFVAQATSQYAARSARSGSLDG